MLKIDHNKIKRQIYLHLNAIIPLFGHYLIRIDKYDSIYEAFCCDKYLGKIMFNNNGSLWVVKYIKVEDEFQQKEVCKLLWKELNRNAEKNGAKLAVDKKGVYPYGYLFLIKRGYKYLLDINDARHTLGNHYLALVCEQCTGLKITTNKRVGIIKKASAANIDCVELIDSNGLYYSLYYDDLLNCKIERIGSNKPMLTRIMRIFNHKS